MQSSAFETLTFIFFAGISGLVFAQTILFAEMNKAVTLFYQEHQQSSGLYTQIVTEQDTVQVSFLLLLVHVCVAVLVVAAYAACVGMEWTQKQTKTVMSGFVALGFALWTVGTMLVGWVRPEFLTYMNIMLCMISPGGSLVLWASLMAILGSHMPHGTMSYSEFFVFWLVASTPPIMIMVLYPTIQSIVYENSSQVLAGSGSGGYPFYLVHQMLGTVSLPILAIIVVVFGMDLSENCSLGALPAPPTAAGAMVLPSIQTILPTLNQKNLNSLFFVVGRGLYGICFFGSVTMFSNYVQHIDSENAVAFNHSAPFVLYGTELAENTMVRDCMLLIAFGMVAGRFLHSLMQRPMVTVCGCSRFRFIFLTDDYNTNAFACSFFAAVLNMSTMWGWYALSNDSATAPMDKVAAAKALAFFVGWSAGAMFIDVVYTSLFVFSSRATGSSAQAVSPLADMSKSKSTSNLIAVATSKLQAKAESTDMGNEESVPSNSGNLVLLGTLVCMLPALIAARFSSGMFGAKVNVIDFKVFTFVLALLSTVTLACVSVNLLMQMMRQETKTE